jgi:signal transduction histidine kinase/FixJ family two-component response regulator
MLRVIYYLQHEREEMLCKEPELSTSTKLMQGFAVGGACTVFFSQLSKLNWSVNHYESNTYAASATLLVVVFLNATSQATSLFNVFGGICVDVMGTISPVIQWVEWQVNVPLLFYLTITLDLSKKSLDIQDFFIIFCSWLGIFSAAVTIDKRLSLRAYMICIGTSVIAVFLALYLLVYSSYCSYTNEQKSQVIESRKAVDIYKDLNKLRLSILKRKLECSVYLALSFPIFPVLYFAGIFKIITVDQQFCGTLIISYCVKQMYAYILTDSHYEILDCRTHDLRVEQSANESRRAYLKYVFHEVRVPLNSISLGLHILLTSGNLTSDDRDVLDMMKESTSFMTETLNDVLSIQKIEDGKLELQFHDTSLESIIRGVCNSQKASYSSKDINIKKVIATEVPKTVLVDRFRIEHVLANLLSNAIKFSPVGSTISIKLACAVDDNICDAVFSVKDEGVGISQENIETVFLPYTQVRPGELQQGKGTGVGLAICREIVQLHGGRINVFSVDKCGSTFTFNIPCKIVTDASRDEKVNDSSTDDKLSLGMTKGDSNEELAGMTKYSISQMNCLIVDDVLSNRKMLNTILTKKGFTCDMAEDGVQGYEKITSDLDKFKVIFLDNFMPNMNGMDCTRKLRKFKFEGIIVGLTGNALDEDVAEFTSAGADIVLSKPLKMNQVDKFIEYLEQYGSKSYRRETDENPAWMALKSLSSK